MEIQIIDDFFKGLETVGLYLPVQFKSLCQSFYQHLLQKLNLIDKELKLINASMRKKVKSEDFKAFIQEKQMEWLDKHPFSKIIIISTTQENDEIEKFVRKVFTEPTAFDNALTTQLMELYDKLVRSNNGYSQIETKERAYGIFAGLAKSYTLHIYQTNNLEEQLEVYQKALNIFIERIKPQTLCINVLMEITNESRLIEETFKIIEKKATMKIDQIQNEYIAAKGALDRNNCYTVIFLDFRILKAYVTNQKSNQYSNYQLLRLITRTNEILQNESEIVELGMNQVILSSDAMRIGKEAISQEFQDAFKKICDAKELFKQVYAKIEPYREKQGTLKYNARDMFFHLLNSGFHSQENEQRVIKLSKDLQSQHFKNQQESILRNQQEKNQQQQHGNPQSQRQTPTMNNKKGLQMDIEKLASYPPFLEMVVLPELRNEILSGLLEFQNRIRSFGIQTRQLKIDLDEPEKAIVMMKSEGGKNYYAYKSQTKQFEARTFKECMLK